MGHTGRRRRRQVLLLADGLGNGGLERQLALLAEYLPPDWERRVWSFSGGPFAEVIRAAGTEVQVHQRSAAWDIRPALPLWRLLIRRRPDVVHSQGWMGTAAAGPACRLLGIPLVDGTIRSGGLNPERGTINRWSMKWATRVIANSRAGLAAYRIGPDRSRVVYNGFDPKRLSLTERAGAPAAGPFTVIMTGRMSEQKDFPAFLEAARQVAQTEPAAWRFLAVGDGPRRAELRRRASDLIAAGVVEFPPPCHEVLPIVRQAHAGVLMTPPHIGEGCSNSIMEYMACGLPVVCSNRGGNPELVLQGETGFLIPPADPSALAEKLRWLRAQPSEATLMGERGRARLLHDFSVENMVRGIVSVYEEALAVPAPGSARVRGC